jgi:type VI protein secretion system component VasF
MSTATALLTIYGNRGDHAHNNSDSNTRSRAMIALNIFLMTATVLAVVALLGWAVQLNERTGSSVS